MAGLVERVIDNNADLGLKTRMIFDELFSGLSVLKYGETGHQSCISGIKPQAQPGFKGAFLCYGQNFLTGIFCLRVQKYIYYSL